MVTALTREKEVYHKKIKKIKKLERERGAHINKTPLSYILTKIFNARKSKRFLCSVEN
jgi:hypothetical protein